MVYASVVDPALASVDEIRYAEMHIPDALKSHDDFPVEPISLLKTQKNLYWSAGPGGYLLLPTFFRFKNTTNSYCRVLTLARDASQPVLAEVPQQANYDECRGFRNVRYLDINGDGMLDVAASVTIKSNSFKGYVDEQVVYLSSSDKRSGYCYSDAASRNLQREHMLSAAKLKKALDGERSRLGIARFECSPNNVP